MYYIFRLKNTLTRVYNNSEYRRRKKCHTYMKVKKASKWGVLALLAIAQFIVVLDSSIVNVAIPAIQEELQFSAANLQWIVSAYILAFGGFLLLGGRVADLFGRRSAFIAGTAAFGAASLVAGLAQSEAIMIAARGLQGLAAAFMTPAALSIVMVMFKEGSERNKALGIWSAVASGGAAAGLLLGGVITQYANWRWNFFINVPITAVVVFLAYRMLPLHESEAKHNNMDLPGAILVTGGLVSLVYGLTNAPAWGWTSGESLAYLGGAVLLLVGFIINESHAKYPLMPLSIFKIRNLTGANLVQLPITAGLMSMFFFMTLYVQEILGYSPTKSGFSFLPVAVTIGIVATITSKHVARIGYKKFMVFAPLLMAFGFYLLTHTPVDGGYITHVLPGLIAIAAGAGMSFVTITIAATSGVPGHESGLASGILSTSQQIGGALGLAILSGVAASVMSSSLAKSDGSELAIAAATVDGYHAAFWIGMAFTILASLFAFFLVKQIKGEKATAAVSMSH